MNMTTLKKTSALLAMLSMSLVANTANADVIYYFSDAGTYNGTSPTATTGSAGSSNVYASATFSNITGGVQLVMSVFNIPSPYYVNDWAFNFTETTNLTALNFASGVEASGTGIDKNKYHLTGAPNTEKFDFGFNFYSSYPGQLGAPNTSTYNLIGTNSSTGILRALNFDSLSSPSGYGAAVHVQGNLSYAVHNGPGTTPDAIKVPEPGALALFSVGLLALGFLKKHSPV